MTTLDTAAHPAAPTNAMGAYPRFSAWLGGGWKLFRKAPLRLFGLFLFILLAEALIQATVPAAGVTLSKWVVGMLGGVVWIMQANLDQRGRLHPLQALGQVRGRWLGLGALSALQLVGFGAQVLAAWLLLGSAGVDMLLLGTPVPVSPVLLGLILAVAIPINMLLLFTIPRLLLDRQPLGKALEGGLLAARRRIGALSLFAGLNALLVALAPATFLLSVLLTGPFILCVGYAAYRETGPIR